MCEGDVLTDDNGVIGTDSSNGVIGTDSSLGVSDFLAGGGAVPLLRHWCNLGRRLGHNR
jgi:hypothetical protein